MQKRKTKMVNVRFTGDEYAALQAACERRGENISGLVRTTMAQIFPNEQITVDHDILELWDRVQSLADQVAELRRMVTGNGQPKAFGATQ